MAHPNARLAELNADRGYDLVVVGAGGAGLSAALFAAIDGASVLVVESTDLIGGTTALSAGTTWIPGSQHAATSNPEDSLELARHYLDAAVGAQSPQALREAFLFHGRTAVAKAEAHSHLRYRAYSKHPDYLSDLPGSTLRGRALEPLPFDGRLLGAWLGLLRPPIVEFTVLGGMMVDRTDIGHLLALGRNAASTRHALRILGRHAMDRLRYKRGTRLVMGNALVGRLLYSLLQFAKVDIVRNTQVVEIERNETGICAVQMRQGDTACRVGVHAGVVLASGGFNRNPALRAKLLPGVDSAWCPAAPGHTAQAHALAQQLGAGYGAAQPTPAFWAPVSIRRRSDGSQAVFPHFVMDRAKPGVLAVNQYGQRFVDESTSYHLFARAILQSQPTSAIPSYLICDARALNAYGIGMVRPGTRKLAPYLADGYLTQANSLAELAQSLGIDAQQLQATVKRFNGLSEAGVDVDFGRGRTAYAQNLGDPQWQGPNPCLGALQQAPYYAVKLYPGDIGAAMGLVTDANAQVLDQAGQPINGLYAVGNDMQSIMGGVYPAPGITIGPGLVFAYIAASHAQRRIQNPGKP